MKYVNQVVSVLLACSILISAIVICRKIENATDMVNAELSNLSREFQLYLNEENTDNDEEILSLHQAASYLKITDVADLLRMVENGELQGTYFQSSSGEYFFVREKLYQWCLLQTEQ